MRSERSTDLSGHIAGQGEFDRLYGKHHDRLAKGAETILLAEGFQQHCALKRVKAQRAG